jgi:hypothetical protein
MKDPTRLGEMRDPYIVAEKVADVQDRALASLLMRAAFRDDGERERTMGLGPLYLVQAVTIRRAMREEFRILLRDN